MPLTYLFDLDMTLVDSSALATQRALQMWSSVRRSLHLIRPYTARSRHAPHQLPALLKAAGHRIGIVTNAPRWYAEDIIGRFNMPVDVLVAHGDTKNHKPDPEPLLKALDDLRAPKHSALYIGDDVGDIEAAYHAGIRSVGVSWGLTSTFAFASVAPDIFIDDPAVLLRSDALDEYRYVAECVFDDDDFEPHWGSTLAGDDEPKVASLGRYFTASDPRHARSGLSRAILSLKSDDTSAAKFGQAFAAGLGALKWSPRYIVPVPPKPSQTRQRFAALLNAALPQLQRKAELFPQGLKCVKEIPNYKAMDAVARAAAIRGAFNTGYTWHKNSVLLVDDVYTTGGTIKECVRVLKAGGAGDVRCLTLAQDQRAFVRKKCQCGRTMRIRVNAKTKERFWGCSGYPDECRRTENV